jgi:hypothetical protein
VSRLAGDREVPTPRGYHPSGSFQSHSGVCNQIDRSRHAAERLHEEFKRRIKTQTGLPSANTAAMLFWALLASGQINMRKVDGWQSLATKPIDQPIDLAA